jgi:hypothetical protein
VAQEGGVTLESAGGRASAELEALVQVYVDMRADWYAGEQSILAIRDALLPILMRHARLGGSVPTVIESETAAGRGLDYEQIAGVEYRFFESSLALPPAMDDQRRLGGLTAADVRLSVILAPLMSVMSYLPLAMSLRGRSRSRWRRLWLVAVRADGGPDPRPPGPRSGALMSVTVNHRDGGGWPNNPSRRRLPVGVERSDGVGFQQVLQVGELGLKLALDQAHQERLRQLEGAAWFRDLGVGDPCPPSTRSQVHRLSTGKGPDLVFSAKPQFGSYSVNSISPSIRRPSSVMTVRKVVPTPIGPADVIFISRLPENHVEAFSGLLTNAKTSSTGWLMTC